MPLTKVQIISLALGELGLAPITAIGTNPIEIAASNLYDLLSEAELSSGFWRFSTPIVQLSLSPDVPVVAQWNYIYNLPADFGKLVRMHPQTYDFEIYSGNTIYSNVNPLWLEYVSTNTSSLSWPAYFTHFFYYLLALELAPGNAQNPQLVGYLDGKSKELRERAMTLDAQNTPSQGIISSPVIDNRFFGCWDRGAGWGYGWD